MTLIGRPAAAVPLVQVVAAPNLMGDPRQRAQYAWEAFSAAMRDLSAPHPGWFMRGGERVATVGYMEAEHPWFIAEALRYEPLFPNKLGSHGIVERSKRIEF